MAASAMCAGDDLDQNGNVHANQDGRKDKPDGKPFFSGERKTKGGRTIKKQAPSTETFQGQGSA